MNIRWSCICTCISEWICIMGKKWKVLFFSSFHGAGEPSSAWAGRACMWAAAVSGALPPLPRLLMPYLLLIRMSRLSATICCSCSANLLPAVWCWRGAQWPSRSVPVPDLKRPFRFVVFFFAWVNSGVQAEGGAGRVWKAWGRGSPAGVGAASELLHLSWQMLEEKRGVMVLIGGEEEPERTRKRCHLTDSQPVFEKPTARLSRIQHRQSWVMIPKTDDMEPIKDKWIWLSALSTMFQGEKRLSFIPWGFC